MIIIDQSPTNSASVPLVIGLITWHGGRRLIDQTSVGGQHPARDVSQYSIESAAISRSNEAIRKVIKVSSMHANDSSIRWFMD